jgi:hypothetical protein
MERRGVVLRRAASPAIYYFCFRMDDPVVGGYTPEKKNCAKRSRLPLIRRPTLIC